MNNWLDPLRAALDDAATPVLYFFRDAAAGGRVTLEREERLPAQFDTETVEERGGLLLFP